MKVEKNCQRSKGKYNAFGAKMVYLQLCKQGIIKTTEKARKDFYAVIQQVDKLILERLFKGDIIKLPYRMGKLYIERKEITPQLVNGKYVYNSGKPNWAETFKLWNEDPEARKQKIFVRYTNNIVYRFKYSKLRRGYKNQLFYNFVAHRNPKVSLSEKIKKGEIETVW